jgi:uncharacterized membrane protein (UPF0127 family)
LAWLQHDFTFPQLTLPTWATLDPNSQLKNPSALSTFWSMKFQKLFVLLLAGLTLASSCKKNEVVAPVAAPVDPSEPTHAQPKLPTIKLWLGSEQISAEMALTAEQERTGMMFRTNITDADAMIFVFPFPQRASFWMKNCPESISAAYIDPDGVIQEIHHLEKQDTNAVAAATDNIQYVLEVSDGWFPRHNVNTGAVVRTERGTLAETFRRQ